ncbi:hypothetical protein HF888_10230 [Bermanella marisrubri]|uniref:Uncharacterized protein n=1 Tax=Bermanella marisrubri TaxID=207949 RepID=Q1N5Y8_9GAMM|nr:hypothetical protein [Bermanella marisrubri]EAT13804.1 hypothetical protein RED65_10439 [Oceanobacter sp. RED65] [Bermanella marisrubri]QIZ84572.1 hypothetical protein HF888_10230 [Bermanella marisrubri]
MRLKRLAGFFTPVNILLIYLFVSCAISIGSFAYFIIFDSSSYEMQLTFWLLGAIAIFLSLVAFILILLKRNLGFMFAFACVLLQTFFIAPANASWALSVGTPILIGVSASSGGLFFDNVAVYDYFYMSNLDFSHLYQLHGDLEPMTWVSLNFLPLAVLASAYRYWKQENDGAPV